LFFVIEVDGRGQQEQQLGDLDDMITFPEQE
jgi:hypothetical protein